MEARLVFFEFNELCLQVVVFLALAGDLGGQLVEVGHDEGIDHFDVLVVLGPQVVLHQSDLLPKHINFLLVLSHLRHRRLHYCLSTHCYVTWFAYFDVVDDGFAAVVLADGVARRGTFRSVSLKKSK